MGSSFYWECLGEDYPFRRNKKYLIYFKGGFTCGGHRGHFNTVKRFTDVGSNVHVMIHLMGTEKRHGVPYSLNEEIWKIHINEMLPKRQVHLVKYGSTYDDIKRITRNGNYDKVVYIRGNENHHIRSTEKSNLNTFDSLIYSLNKQHIGLDFFYLNRPDVKTLCATEFARALIKSKKCQRENCRCKYKKLLFYLPDELSRESSIYILNKLKKCYLRV